MTDPAAIEARSEKRKRPNLQKPGRSKQDYGTPLEFIAAVTRRFGRIDWDLAAWPHNAKADLYFTEHQDSLAQDWTFSSALAPRVHVAWLNPPFAHIDPWSAKCGECRFLPRWTLLLVPASMGSGWWRDHVLGKCMAFGIPRLCFDGVAPYPKDLALCAYGFGVNGTGYWDWRVPSPRPAPTASSTTSVRPSRPTTRRASKARLMRRLGGSDALP